MFLRRLVVVVGLLLIPVAAGADGHRADLFFGFSLAEGSWLKGFHVSGEHLLPGLEKHVFLVGDYSVHQGTRHVFQSGLNFSKDGGPVGLSGRVLLGGVSDDAGTDLTLAVGGGFQVKIPASGSTRAAKPHWVLHVQADYMQRKGSNDGFVRVSVGALVRFPRVRK